jgi:hypothetical protein
VVGIVAEGAIEEPDGPGRLVFERGPFGGGWIGAACRRGLRLGCCHREGERACSVGSPGRQKVFPDRLFGRCVEPVGRRGPGKHAGNGEDELTFALVGELPGADERGEVSVAAGLGSTHEAGHDDQPLLVELRLRLHSHRFGRDPGP